MLYKKLLAMIFIIISVQNLSSIGLELINPMAIPGAKSMESDFEFVYLNEHCFNTYIPDEYWTFEQSKQDYADQLLAFTEKLEKIDNREENLDLNLLRGLCYFYLFNLDQNWALEKAIAEIEMIEEYNNPDYRYLWFLGAIYAASLSPFDAIKEFEYISESLPEDKLHPMFWYDYAFASMGAFMPSTAVDCFEKLGKYSDYDLQQNRFYMDLKDKMQRASGETIIPASELYSIRNYEKGVGIVSMPLGMWLPIQDDWVPNMMDFNNNFSGVIFKSGPLMSDGNDSITYTISVFTFHESENVYEKFSSVAPYCKEVSDPDMDSKYRIMEIKNPDQYVPIGGAHGYVAFYEADVDDSRNLQIEMPSMISTGKDENTSYFPIGKNYLRMDGKITYVIMFDSCEDIFEKSRKDFIHLINNAVFISE